MKKLNLIFLSAFLVFAIALVGCNQTGNDGSSSNSSQPNPDVPETISQQALASVQMELIHFLVIHMILRPFLVKRVTTMQKLILTMIIQKL